jgi:hypothetical protein
MAVALAVKVCEASNYQQPQALDTYAAALAEDGQFEKACEIADNALEIAKKSVPTAALRQLIEKLEARKTLYQSQRPYRQ